MPATITQNYTKKQKAAILLAEDELSDEEIAQRVGIVRKTLHNWKQSSEFAAMVNNAKDQIVAEAMRVPIADKEWRVRILNDLFERNWQIIEKRAERHRQEREDSPSNAARAVFGDVTPAEAETGMLVAQPKIAANGKTVIEWAFDKALALEIRDTLKQAAQELGQLVDKREETRHIEVRMVAQRIAEETGMNESEVLAEAERIVAMASAE